jgi:hypothetical protein
MGLKLRKKAEQKPPVQAELLPEETPEPVRTDEPADTAWIDEAMVVKESFNLDDVNSLFSKIHKVIDDMAKQADSHKVIDRQSMEIAIGMGTQAKQYINKVEKRRKQVKAPYLEFTKRLDSLAGGVKKRLEAVQESLRVKIRPVMIELKAKEDAARAKAAEEAQKAAASNSVAPPPPPAAPSGPTKTTSGSAELKEKVTWEVSDITKVPAEYLTVIASKVNHAAKAGKEIPGIKITREQDVSMRANKS